MNIGDVKRNFKQFLCRVYTLVYGLFHKIEKKVIFISYRGKQYSCNPRAVSEEMHILFPEYKIVWILDDFNDPYKLVPHYVTVVKGTDKTLSFYREVATTFALVSNEEFRGDIFKRSGQFFIQTWHGDMELKKVLYNASGFNKNNPIIDDKVTDISVAGSDYGYKRYRTAFLYTGVISTVGTPRNDIFFKCNLEKTIKIRLGLPLDKKVLLYAPTFRKGEDNMNIFVDLEEILFELENKGNQWVCLIRAHSNTKELIYDCDQENFFNVSNYPDMQDILYITDYLITDYSSCAADFALKRKPLILAVFDYEKYIITSRALSINLEEAGFLVAKSQRELIELVKSKTNEDYQKSCDDILTFFGNKDSGNASNYICNIINENYSKRKHT